MTARTSLLGGVRPLEVSKDRRQHFESLSDDLVEKALKAYDAFHGQQPPKHPTAARRWKLLKRKKALNMYREVGTPPKKAREDQTYLCSGVLPGSIEDMLSGAYADDIETMRIRMSIFSHMFLDAKMVCVFENNPLETSHVVFSGIKWMAFKTSVSTALAHDRDILVYNRLGRMTDRQGRYFVYYVLKSVELDEFPANHHNLKRGLVSLCYLFRQFQEELVGCFMIGTSTMGGGLPRSVVELIMVDRMLSVQNFLVIARAKAYSARLANSLDRIPSTSTVCDVCMKKPTLLRSSLELCMGCRRNTCRKCREWCTVFRLDVRTQRPSKERFCTQCIADVTRPTMSAFYMCSLNESTNKTNVPDRGATSVSTSSGPGHSSNASSSQSHDMNSSDAWLPAPSDLTNLASFVERASLASSRDLQWNQDELDYYTDVLRESGHLKVPQFTDYNTSRSSRQAPSFTQNFHPGSSLPVPDHDKDGCHILHGDAADDNSDQQFFSVDDLD